MRPISPDGVHPNKYIPKHGSGAHRMLDTFRSNAPVIFQNLL